ncbi:peptidoglycan DD-metalloendopeptidase family protein [Rheinheimera texasensis]|uniref:peptidoglycan DD-metalloendopeptidase family protein n=1 Tax=Rheinheimera texasensis TaxID=306205 RepID=UPI0004E130B1|nr:peptidoglycan DD-metalloendopeptidase family protein [Rheinheimera texasensis]
MFSSLPTPHRVLIATLATILSVTLLLPSEKAEASKDSEKSSLEVGKRYSLAVPVVTDSLPQTAETTIPTEDNSLEWISVEVKKGDNLGSVFKRAKIDAQTMQAVLDAGKDAKNLTRLFPGVQVEFGLDAEGKLQELRYNLSNLKTLRITRGDDGQFVAKQLQKEIETRTEVVAGIISGSFWGSAMNAGLSEAQIIDLANVFGYDIDFALDIRSGDSFSVMFERQYAEGQFIGNGAIVAAQFQNQGQLYQAVRHTDGNFYKPDGGSMRQAFLRAPVNFRYVSSNFNPRRLHPVLGKIKAHNGVDYVAPMGTPIMAAGDGKVIESAMKGANGNYVVIQHANGIVTKYLHLSKRDVKRGDKVKQGDIVGRLGATGRVTGAHLHYEFVVGGVHRNPRTVKLPQAEPLQGVARVEFTKIAKQQIAQLKAHERVVLAANQ